MFDRSRRRQCYVISNKQFLYCRISHQNRHSFVAGIKEVHCSDFYVVDAGSWLGCEIIFVAIIFCIQTLKLSHSWQLCGLNGTNYN